jgi:hypothetical protein
MKIKLIAAAALAAISLATTSAQAEGTNESIAKAGVSIHFGIPFFAPYYGPYYYGPHCFYNRFGHYVCR